MHWTKLGLIFTPQGDKPWMRTHACLPVPIQRTVDIYRVYFASRDDKNRSHIGYFDIRMREPFDIVHISQEPVLAPGPLGTHDEHGVYPSSIVIHAGKYYLYTSCWNRGERPSLNYNSIGLAISEDGETFRRFSVAPILARSQHDPCFVAMPMVMHERGRWRMYYSSGYRWEETNDGLVSYYKIKCAESEDGLHWTPNGHVAIDHATPDEKNIARPWIMHGGDDYQAWYAFNRGPGYRIGFAVSPDGQNWERRDHRAGIHCSQSGWDSQMIAHPAVVQQDGRWFMFYNGNRYGKDGVGLAVADSTSDS